MVWQIPEAEKQLRQSHGVAIPYPDPGPTSLRRSYSNLTLIAFIILTIPSPFIACRSNTPSPFTTHHLTRSWHLLHPFEHKPSHNVIH